MNNVTVGDFYEDEYGSLYEVVDVASKGIMLCRLKDNKTIIVEHHTIYNWISNGALTVYLTSEQIAT
jgi:hypothetical protein